MKKLLSLLLSVSLIVTCSMHAVASEQPDEFTSAKSCISTFIDGDGMENTVIITSSNPGTAHVDYYIAGELINTVDALILESPETVAKTVCDDGTLDQEVRITFTDVIKSTSDTFVEPISKYVRVSPSFDIPDADVEGGHSRGYIYQGKINYNTYYGPYGNYTDKLHIYKDGGSTTYTYKTINSAAGTAASVVISVVAAVLTVLYGPLGSLAANLVASAAVAVGTTIVGGIIQGAISKRYYVQTTFFNVKAKDLPTSRERFYTAKQYRLALEGGGYSSSYYFEGYLPWNSNAVAYWMFSDFFAYQYPGVSSYSY